VTNAGFTALIGAVRDDFPKTRMFEIVHAVKKVTRDC
jgi:hypothetical protein